MTALVDEQVRRQMMKLARRRHGNPPLIPDTPPGRAMIVNLFAVGMKDVRVMAPWMTEEQTQEFKTEAIVRGPWFGEQLGSNVELTDKERSEEELWNMWPIDKTRDEIEERNRQKHSKKVADRNRALRDAARAAGAMAADLDVRGEALLVLLTFEWVSITDLVKIVAKCKAWRRFDGKPLPRPSLQKGVRRTLDGLAKAELIEVKRGTTANGEMMRFARLSRGRNAFLSPRTTGHGTNTSRPDAGSPCATDASSAPGPVSTPGPESVSGLSLLQEPGNAAQGRPSPASDASERGPAAGTSDGLSRVRRWSPSQITPRMGEAAAVAGRSETPLAILTISS